MVLNNNIQGEFRNFHDNLAKYTALYDDILSKFRL